MSERKSEISTDSMCRACLTNNLNCLILLSKKSISTQLTNAEVFEFCTGIKIPDKFRLCFKCLSDLKHSFIFKEMCLKNNLVYSSICQTTTAVASEEVSLESIKQESEDENVIELEDSDATEEFCAKSDESSCTEIFELTPIPQTIQEASQEIYDSSDEASTNEEDQENSIETVVQKVNRSKQSKSSNENSAKLKTLRIRSNEIKIHCIFCTRVFLRESTYKNHMESVHSSKTRKRSRSIIKIESPKKKLKNNR